jgi:hypothetical protein
MLLVLKVGEIGVLIVAYSFRIRVHFLEPLESFRVSDRCPTPSSYSNFGSVMLGAWALFSSTAEWENTSSLNSYTGTTYPYLVVAKWGELPRFVYYYYYVIFAIDHSNLGSSIFVFCSSFLFVLLPCGFISILSLVDWARSAEMFSFFASLLDASSALDRCCQLAYDRFGASVSAVSPMHLGRGVRILRLWHVSHYCWCCVVDVYCSNFYLLESFFALFLGAVSALFSVWFYCDQLTALLVESTSLDFSSVCPCWWRALTWTVEHHARASSFTRILDLHCHECVAALGSLHSGELTLLMRLLVWHSLHLLRLVFLRPSMCLFWPVSKLESARSFQFLLFPRFSLDLAGFLRWILGFHKLYKVFSRRVLDFNWQFCFGKDDDIV